MDTTGSKMILEIGIDITERKKAETELKATVSTLERLNEELQEFTFIASHDLQEPLRKIQTFGNMLIKKHQESLNPEGRDYMERIIKGANRMSELVRALLNYSRSSTDRLNCNPVSVTEVVKEAVSDLELLIDSAEGTVEIGDLSTVEADALLLRQLFQNIIGNAIKYRKESEPPVVKVYANIVNDTCRISVEDNGIGFERCYSEQIFKPFQRLHGKSSPYSGVGMGLAICRKIAARHGGDITAQGVPGQGAAFIAAIPAAPEKWLQIMN